MRKTILMILPLWVIFILKRYIYESLDNIGKNNYYRIFSCKNGAKLLIFRNREI